MMSVHVFVFQPMFPNIPTARPVFFWFRKRDQTIAQSIVLMLFHKLKSIGSSDLSECSAEFFNFDSWPKLNIFSIILCSRPAPAQCWSQAAETWTGCCNSVAPNFDQVLIFFLTGLFWLTGSWFALLGKGAWPMAATVPQVWICSLDGCWSAHTDCVWVPASVWQRYARCWAFEPCSCHFDVWV